MFLPPILKYHSSADAYIDNNDIFWHRISSYYDFSLGNEYEAIMLINSFKLNYSH